VTVLRTSRGAASSAPSSAPPQAWQKRAVAAFGSPQVRHAATTKSRPVEPRLERRGYRSIAKAIFTVVRYVVIRSPSTTALIETTSAP
jgi:hypothetical protein